MAYRAEIEIGVKGAKQLEEIHKRISDLSKTIDRTNKQEHFGTKQVASLEQYSLAVSEAAANLNKTRIQLDKNGNAIKTYKKAIDQYVTAIGSANEAQAITNRQLEQEISSRTKATAVLKAYNAAAAAPTRRGAATTMTGAYLRGQPVRGRTQYGGPIGPGPASSILGGQSAPVEGRIQRALQAQREELALKQALEKLELRSIANHNQRLNLQAQYVKELKTVTQSARIGPQPAPGFDPAPAAAKARQRIALTEIGRQTVRSRTAVTRTELGGLQKNLAKLNQVEAKAKLEAARATSQLVGEQTAMSRVIKEAEQSFTQAKEAARATTKAINERTAALKKEADAAKQSRRATRQAVGKRAGAGLQGLLTGGAFPLLFGGPSFSALGGGIGGGIGGLVGGAGAGLAGGVALSAVGAAFDAMARQALELGSALRDPTNNIEKLTSMLSIAGTETAGLIKDLENLGATEVAAAVALDELNAKLSAMGTSPEAFKQASIEVDNALADLTIAMVGFGRVLLPLIQSVTKFAAGFLGAGGTAGGAVGSASQASLTRANAEAARTQFVEQRLNNEKDILDLRRQDLRIDQAQRATLEGNLEIQKKTRELEATRTRARFETNAAAKRQLNLEAKILFLQREQLVIAKANAEARARQAIMFEAMTLAFDTNLQNAKNNLAGLDRLATDIDLLDRTSNREFLRGAPKNVFAQRMKSLKAIQDAEQLIFDQRIEQINTEFNLSGVVREKRIESIQAEKVASEQAYLNQLRLLELQKARLDLQVLQTEQQAKEARITKEQELALAREVSPLSMYENSGLDNLFQGLGFFTETVNLADQKLLEYNTTLANYGRQLENLQKQRDVPGLGVEDIGKIDSQIVSITSLRDAYKDLQPAINKVAVEGQAFADAFSLVNPIIQNIGQSMTDIVAGTKSVEEAFADMLKNIAQILMQQGAIMIAQYIAIGLARAFAGMGGSGNTSFGGNGVGQGQLLAPVSKGGNANSLLSSFLNPGKTFAEGGFVDRPTNALIGEGSEPEYVIPESKMRESMARYSRGSRGASVIPETGSGDSAASGGGTAVATPIDVRYTVERINSVDYVTADQFQRGMQNAATQGAKQGEQNTLKRLQMSGSTRKRLGL